MMTPKNKSQNDRRFAVIHTKDGSIKIHNPNYDFVFGYILCENTEEIAIALFSRDCVYDGILVMKMDNVLAIEKESKYIQSMETLYALRQNDFSFHRLNEDRLLDSVIDIASIEKQIVAIEVLDSGGIDIVGIIQNVENGICEIRQLDEYGDEDGISYIGIADITQLACDSESERIIQGIHNLKVRKLK